jgi:hypothetical protein
VSSWLRLRGPELGIESPLPGQSSEFSGAYRFERPIDWCKLAPGLENTLQRRVSLESNERNFLSLSVRMTDLPITPQKILKALEEQRGDGK